MRSLRAIVASAVLASCIAPPAHRVTLAGIDIRAESPEEAQRVAGLLERRLEEVHASLVDTKSAHFKVVVWDDERFTSKYGVRGLEGRTTYDPLGGASTLAVAESTLPQSLLHELVHVLLGPSWRPLPGALEEGLANEMGYRAECEGAPDPRAALERLRDGWFFACAPSSERRIVVEFTSAAEDRRVRNVYSLADAVEYVGVPLSEIMARPRLVRSFNATRRGEGEFYALGTILAGRILDRAGGDPAVLHRLCVDASAAGEERVPLAAILRAAGFADESEFDHWRAERLTEALARRLFGEPALDLLVGRMEERFARPITLDEFLGELDVTVRRQASGPTLRLAAREDLIDLVRRSWGSAPAAARGAGTEAGR